MVFQYEIDAVKKYANEIYGIKYVEQNNYLFIKNEKDNFKVNLTDKQRFGEYTLFHKNHYYDLNNYHTQGKYKDLHFLIFVAATHSINKEVGIKSTAEDWFAFKKDALKYYFERGK